MGRVVGQGWWGKGGARVVYGEHLLLQQLATVQRRARRVTNDAAAAAAAASAWCLWRLGRRTQLRATATVRAHARGAMLLRLLRLLRLLLLLRLRWRRAHARCLRGGGSSEECEG